MKKVLGLDLGTTSIGWAVILQAESDEERSSILGAGSRVNPLSSDEKDNIERGKDISTNADRRLKRSARRNLFRYKLRRDNLIALMKELGWIDDNSILFEQGNDSTFHTYLLRAKAVSEEINLQELARVLLMINKKRGYKSSRKVSPAKKDGKLIDGIKVAEELNEKSQTPAQYALTLLKDNKPLPDFYTSDLRAEFDKIWEYQQAFYPEILTPSLKDEIKDKNWKTIAGIFERFDIQTADNKGKERNRTALEWRVEALNNELSKDKLSYVICDLSQQIQDSAGYLETISDRSKQLYFNKMTVGQYLWKELSKDRHFRVKNKVFYRQDYIEEFNQIWDTQAKFHTELTEELRNKIRDQIIFISVVLSHRNL